MPTDPEPRILLCIPERQIRQLAPRLVERGLGVALFSRFARDEAASLTAQGTYCFPDLYAALYRRAASGWPLLGADRGAPWSSAA